VTLRKVFGKRGKRFPSLIGMKGEPLSCRKCFDKYRWEHKIYSPWDCRNNPLLNVPPNFYGGWSFDKEHWALCLLKGASQKTLLVCHPPFEQNCAPKRPVVLFLVSPLNTPCVTVLKRTTYLTEGGHKTNVADKSRVMVLHHGVNREGA